MNNAWDRIADQVGQGLIQESEKNDPTVSRVTVKQSCYALTLRKINYLAFREFNYSF